MPAEDERGLRQRPLKGLDAEYGRWKAAARRDGKSFAQWARERLNAAAAPDSAVAPGGVLSEDREFHAALDVLTDHYYAVGPPSTLVRMAVVVVARMVQLGRDPFRLAREPAAEPRPAPSPKR